jgi:hypothetical protein
MEEHENACQKGDSRPEEGKWKTGGGKVESGDVSIVPPK